MKKFNEMSMQEVKDYAFNCSFVPVAKFDYGDTYTIDKFIELVRTLDIMDYDGMGYLAFEIEGELYECKGMNVLCTVRFLERKKEEGITHIRWYNK